MMEKIKSFNEDLCRQVETEVEASMQVIAEKYGLKLKMLPGTLSSDTVIFVPRCQLEVPERTETVASAKEEEDYLQYAESFGVRGRWLGKAFQRGNFTYQVVGLRINEPNECIILQRSDGSRCYENGKLVARYLGN